MKYHEIKTLVLAAVAEQYCTVEGMKKFVEPQIAAEIKDADLEAVLDRMRGEGDLVMLNNGAFSAYFTNDKPPLRFFRAGSGKIDAIYDKNLDHPNAGLPVMSVALNDASSAPIEEIAVVPYYTAAELQRIENLTAQSYTRIEIADEMGIDSYLLTRRARHDLPTRQAFSNGHQRRESLVARDKPSEPETTETKPPKARPRVVDVRPNARVAEMKIKIVPDEVEENEENKPLTRRPPLFERLCACGEPLGARTKECRDCWLRGKHPTAFAAESKKPSAADRRIKNFLAESSIEPDRINEILLGIFLDTAPERVKERFAEALCGELLETSRQAA